MCPNEIFELTILMLTFCKNVFLKDIECGQVEKKWYSFSTSPVSHDRQTRLCLSIFEQRPFSMAREWALSRN